MTSPDDRLVSLIRTIVEATVNETLQQARTTAIASGTVDDLTEDLDMVAIRLDREAMTGDSSQSSNYGSPGTLYASRIGSMYPGDQVRVNFDGPAGASAYQTGVEKQIVLPFGVEAGARIVIDGEAGAIYFLDQLGQVVGKMDSNIWEIGDIEGTTQRVTLDPIGGLRLRSGNNVVVVDFNAQPALTLRDPNSGVTNVVLRNSGLHIIDPSTGTDLEITTGGHGIPDPKYGEPIVEVSPGTTMDTPTSTTYTGDDLEIRHVVAWHGNSSIAAPTFTPPTGYTERTDIADNTNGRTLHSTTATRHPAVPAAVRTFVNSSGAWQHALGETVVVRGGGSSSPTWASVSQAFTEVANATSVTTSLAKPTGTAEGDALLAFVDMGNFGGTVPIGWTTPEGWIFLGATFSLSGAGPSQSMLAGGAWYNRAGPSEPAEYEITINFGDLGYKRLSAEIHRITNPGAFSTGAGFRMNGRTMPRLLDVVTLTSSRSRVVLGGPDGIGEILGTNPIPPDFDSLELVCALKSVGGDGGTTRSIFVRFNGDAGAGAYAWRADGTLGSTVNNSSTAIIIGDLWTADGGFRSTMEVDIPDYSRPTERATTVGQFTMRAGGGTPTTLLGRTGGRWTGTNPITSVQVDTASLVTQMASGSKFWLYGK